MGSLCLNLHVPDAASIVLSACVETCQCGTQSLVPAHLVAFLLSPLMWWAFLQDLESNWVVVSIIKICQSVSPGFCLKVTL